MPKTLRYPKHNESCWLNDQPEGGITVPCWCTCPTGREHRVEEFTEMLVSRNAWDIFWYSRRLLPGEGDEVNRRVGEYITRKNAEGW